MWFMNKLDPYEKAVPELRAFIAEFVENRRKDVGQIESALATQDFKILERMGHTFKGMCEPYGLPELGHLGSEMEQAALRKDVSTCQRLCQDMKNLLMAVQVESGS